MNRLPIDLCLPLLKYSYAESNNAQDPISWSHYSAVDLCLLLRGDNDGHGRLQMDIIERTTTKETIDLAYHIDVASAARRSAQQSGISLMIEQLPIFGITKDALLALRYRTKVGRARRIQLRLQDALQCGEVVSILKHRGLDFQDQRPTSSRPSTAVPRLDASTSGLRPLTSPHSSLHAGRTRSSQTPFHPPSMALGSLGQDSQQSSQPVHSDSTGIRSQADERLSKPPLTGLDQIKALGATPRPLSSQSSSSFAPPHTAPDISVRQLDSKQGAERSRTEAAYTMQDNAHSSQQISSDIVGPRPWTASSPNTLSSILQEPAAHMPDLSRLPAVTGPDAATRTRSRPSSALELPPLQQPRLANAQPPSVSSSSLFSVPKLQVLQSHDRQAGLECETRPKPVNGGSIPAVSDTARPLSATAYAEEQAKNNNQLLPHCRAEKTMPRLSSLMDAPHELESEYEPTETSSVVHQRQPGRTRPIDNQPVPRHDFLRGATDNLNEDISLREYAAQRPQDREAALNKFMMDRLSDPAFATLCADVEGCWRRIALGL